MGRLGRLPRQMGDQRLHSLIKMLRCQLSDPALKVEVAEKVRRRFIGKFGGGMRKPVAVGLRYVGNHNRQRLFRWPGASKQKTLGLDKRERGVALDCFQIAVTMPTTQMRKRRLWRPPISPFYLCAQASGLACKGFCACGLCSVFAHMRGSERQVCFIPRGSGPAVRGSF